MTELGYEQGAPLTTLRDRLRELTKAGVIDQRKRESFPGTLEYELTPAGEGLLEIAGLVDGWLERAPSGPRRLGEDGAKTAVKALVDGWSTRLLRALAVKPLALVELDSLISGVNYPTLERRLTAMRMAGQVEACPASGPGTPYAVTDWLRHGVGPLLAGARWECLHCNVDSVPLAAIDVEAAFLLAAPLLELPQELSGSCRLAAEAPNGQEQRHAGVVVNLQEGSLASCTSRLDGSVVAWARGSIAGWFRALLENDVDPLELGGHDRLARAVVEGLHGKLFGLRYAMAQ